MAMLDWVVYVVYVALICVMSFFSPFLSVFHFVLCIPWSVFDSSRDLVWPVFNSFRDFVCWGREGRRHEQRELLRIILHRLINVP